MIIKELTGHIYRNSTIETCDDCGNCNGGNCDHCKEVYYVDGEQFNDLELAQKKANELYKEMEILIGRENYMSKDVFPINMDFYLNDWGELVVSFYDYGYYDKEADKPVEGEGEVVIVCNPNSPIYDKYYEEAYIATKRWCQCTCMDKAEQAYGNDCSICGCSDPSCYREMKAGNRKERKWYM